MSAEPKNRRVTFRAPRALNASVDAKEKKLGISRSEFASRAIRHKLLDEIVAKATPEQLQVIDAGIDAIFRLALKEAKRT